MRPRYLVVLLVMVALLFVLTASAATAQPRSSVAPGDHSACAADVAPLGVVFGATASAPATHQQLAGHQTTKRTTYVYITDTGAKYHRKSCQYVKHSKHRVTLKWAKKHGYKPCKVCKPPK